MPSQYLRESEKASMLYLNVEEPPAKRLNQSIMLEALTTWSPAFYTRSSRLRFTLRADTINNHNVYFNEDEKRTREITKPLLAYCRDTQLLCLLTMY